VLTERVLVSVRLFLISPTSLTGLDRRIQSALSAVCLLPTTADV
jgi:hypothetical protein